MKYLPKRITVMKRLIGESFSFTKKGLQANHHKAISITITDSFGHEFKNNQTFLTNEKGELNMSTDAVQEWI